MGARRFKPQFTAATVSNVKHEAQRRIIALVGASDLDDAQVRQLNALMRANELTLKIALGQSLSTQENAERAALETLATDIKAVRAKSNEIEAMSPIPLDFKDDSRWT